ncbi:MAG TPA: DUF6089 family protein [Tenuifilaceae bacterium]|nr:DUF6089 family protein [Tenuifilaceae bacterium]HPI44753.1 DUF6089 family protein [Tenuifilaceae bacterium]HPN21139.1 DUF6089 family protein [Tenuifilaceae bacterium]HPV55584.1 DUF6089 family protein [Tenuifilaceae bacterium]
MNKYLVLPIIILLISIDSFSQDKRDIGLTLGGNYYYGDFNESLPLQSPALGIGVIFRYNFDKHYSIRASAQYGSISGSYNGNYYLPGTFPSTFSKSYLDAQIMGEFNFLSFSPIGERKKKITPFVNLGIGISQVGGAFIPNLPFGIGVKYTPIQRHTVAIEWRFQKTMVDNIDNYMPLNSNAIIHNNDWLAFVGLTYTYRLYNNSEICPVYK